MANCNECKNYFKHHYDQSCCGGDLESIECDLFEQLPNEEIKVVKKKSDTIQELIEFCEEIAQEHEERAEKYDRWDEEESVYADYCTSYAAKHRKIAEILSGIICGKPILFSSVQQCTLCGNTCPLSPQEQFDVRNELCGAKNGGEQQ